MTKYEDSVLYKLRNDEEYRKRTFEAMDRVIEEFENKMKESKEEKNMDELKHLENEVFKELGRLVNKIDKLEKEVADLKKEKSIVMNINVNEKDNNSAEEMIKLINEKLRKTGGLTY